VAHNWSRRFVAVVPVLLLRQMRTREIALAARRHTLSQRELPHIGHMQARAHDALLYLLKRAVPAQAQQKVFRRDVSQI
jgi:hypothetical protein